MWEQCKPVDEIFHSDAHTLTDTLQRATQPVILRGLIHQWPLVKAGLESDNAAINYLMQFYNQKPVHTLLADAKQKGRYFYNDDLSGFNFERQVLSLETVLQRLSDSQEQHSLYVGSTSINQILPGFRQHNELAELQDKPLVSIWIGNQSRIAAHYDIPDNVAAVAVGKRRFTLFPPEQLDNLYVGPLDFTPAGQSASLVDFHNPDFNKYPQFKTAIRHALVAELEAGDAIFIPSMWWHHVEGLSSLNVLVNYWWRQLPNFMAAPTEALNHALLSIRELPAEQRAIWKQMFDHYVFDPQPNEHIPTSAKGSLNPLDELAARNLRAQLINKLNR